MDNDLQIPRPVPRWLRDRNTPYVIEEYDLTNDEWIEIQRTLSGREAEDLLILDPNAKRRMYILPDRDFDPNWRQDNWN